MKELIVSFQSTCLLELADLYFSVSSCSCEHTGCRVRYITSVHTVRTFQCAVTKFTPSFPFVTGRGLQEHPSTWANPIPSQDSFLSNCFILAAVSRCYATMYGTRPMSVKKGSSYFGGVSYYLQDKRGQKAICLVEYRKAQSWTQEVKSARREKEKSGGGRIWRVEILVLARKVAEQSIWSCFADVTFCNFTRSICWHRKLAYVSMTCVIFLVLFKVQIGGLQDVQHSLFYSVLMKGYC